jgi:phosphate transport system permease protein
MPFIATGVTLAIARAAGETAPLLFTCLFNQYDIKGLWEPTATLSVLIYNFAISPYPNQQKLAWVAALVILILILGISIVARMVSRRKVY